MNTDFQIVIDLELSLLTHSVRSDAHRLDVLLHNDFFEIGSSGRTYTKDITIERLRQEAQNTSAEIAVTAHDFVPIRLSNDLVQLRFLTRRQQADRSISASLRSSIWKCTEGQWQMLFHQGTPA